MADNDHPDARRFTRAPLNLLENAAPFFAIRLLFCPASPGLPFAQVLFGVFVGVRALHATFYLRATQAPTAP